MATNTYVTKDELQGHEGATTVAKYITQVAPGDGKVYDIATHHAITFKNGSADQSEGIKWNGIDDITVIIPDVSDLVNTPIDFVGTIGANGTITYNNDATAPKRGDLVFASADCPDFAGQAIEAGDMAIWDGSKWVIVSGENQVNILAGGAAGTDTNTTTIAIGSAKDVLSVEGKELALAIDYADVKNHIKGIKETLTVDFTANANKVTVADAYVGLTQASASTLTIASERTISNATDLADGTVTFASASGFYKSGDFANVFTSGEFPVYGKNAATAWDVNGKVSSDKQFVTDVTALGSATLVSSAQGQSGAFGFVSGVTASTTTSYVTGMTTAASTDESKFSMVNGVEFDSTIETFVSGLGSASNDKNSVADAADTVITAATIGAVTVESGSASSHNVITGLGDGNDYLTSVDFAAASTDTWKQSVVSSASVVGNVLTFGSANVMKPVEVRVSKGGFTYGTVSQASSTFKTRSFVKGGYKVTSADYKWTTSNAVSVDAPKAFVAVSTANATPSYGSLGELSLTGGKATVPADSFYNAQTSEGTLPTWTAPAASGLLSASVSTVLSKTDEKFLAATVETIEVAGAYSLVSSDTASTGYVKVGKAGDAKLDLTATVADVVTDVQVNDGTSWATVVSAPVVSA